MCFPPARMHFCELTARLSLPSAELVSAVPRKIDLYWFIPALTKRSVAKRDFGGKGRKGDDAKQREKGTRAPQGQPLFHTRAYRLGEEQLTVLVRDDTARLPEGVVLVLDEVVDEGRPDSCGRPRVGVGELDGHSWLGGRKGVGCECSACEEIRDLGSWEDSGEHPVVGGK